MENNPLVTIICTSYNHAKFIEQSLNSVINQRYKNIELIIADNASEDNSVEVIENWLKNHNGIKFIKNESNLGITRSFNKAVKYANGTFLMDLSGDDVLMENCIGELIANYKLSTDVSLVFGNANVVDENNNFLHSYFSLNHDGTITDKSILTLDYIRILEGGVAICSVSAIFKKDTFDKLGGYDENLDYEDLDFWIRLSRNHTIKYVDKILVHKRKVLQSLSSHFLYKSSIDLNKSNLMILQKAYMLNRTKAEHKALLKRVHNYILVNIKTKNYVYVVYAFILKLRIFMSVKR